MMDHTYKAGARGIIPGFEEYYPMATDQTSIKGFVIYQAMKD